MVEMIEPKHFKQISYLIERWSIPSYLDNAKQKTAIGRLYYYVFLEIREIIKAKLSPSQLEELESGNLRGRIHIILINLLYKVGLTEEGRNLWKLRDIRNFADYYLQMGGVEASLSEAKKLTKNLEDSFQKIRNLPESQVQQAFNSVV